MPVGAARPSATAPTAARALCDPRTRIPKMFVLSLRKSCRGVSHEWEKTREMMRSTASRTAGISTQIVST